MGQAPRKAFLMLAIALLVEPVHGLLGVSLPTILPTSTSGETKPHRLQGRTTIGATQSNGDVDTERQGACSGFELLHGYRISGREIAQVESNHFSDCCASCAAHFNCTAWIHLWGTCVLKEQPVIPGGWVNEMVGAITMSSSQNLATDLQALAPRDCTECGRDFVVLHGYDVVGRTVAGVVSSLSSYKECAVRCKSHTKCTGFTYIRGDCWLKEVTSLPDVTKIIVSGYRSPSKCASSVNDTSATCTPPDYESGMLTFGETALLQKEVVEMGTSATSSTEKSRSVIVLMSTSLQEDVAKLKQLLATLRPFNERHGPYPVAIFHEDFTRRLMISIQEDTKLLLKFVRIESRIGHHLQARHDAMQGVRFRYWTGNANARPYPYFHTEPGYLRPWSKRLVSYPMGYQHMCNFFAGAGYMLPFFDNYDFYMRLDSDSTCPEGMPDYFQQMESQKADYYFRTTFKEGGEVALGLWDEAEQFMAKSGRGADRIHRLRQPSNPNVCEGFDPLLGLDNAPAINGYGESLVQTTPCQAGLFDEVPAYFTNFEVARLSILRSQAYQEWYQHLSTTGGIFFHRWGDAPIRFLGLQMLPNPVVALKVQGCSHESRK